MRFKGDTKYVPRYGYALEGFGSGWQWDNLEWKRSGLARNSYSFQFLRPSAKLFWKSNGNCFFSSSKSNSISSTASRRPRRLFLKGGHSPLSSGAAVRQRSWRRILVRTLRRNAFVVLTKKYTFHPRRYCCWGHQLEFSPVPLRIAQPSIPKSAWLHDGAFLDIFAITLSEGKRLVCTTISKPDISVWSIAQTSSERERMS